MLETASASRLMVLPSLPMDLLPSICSHLRVRDLMGGAWIGDLGVAAPRRRSSRANDMLLGSAERPLMLGPDHPDFPIPNMFMFRPVQRTVLSVAEFEEAVAAADPFDTICIAADLSFTQADIDCGISSLQKPLRLIGADVEAHAEGHRFDNAPGIALVNLTIFAGNIDVAVEPICEEAVFPALQIQWGAVHPEAVHGSF
ncbi:hypothetical protein EMIHUDRAFT_196374 [Emiliania huxleyi CCMP1516]|uniref:F-box domain-containing protein n=2 Tax=Emiliania huxleyi TaxID=2903 RepID=A0A0D3J3Z9_EMIH1|nr:hypothetical protein EMIHUDRAFT_196374 [Emiliania huxleyi CCMP1516]EOD18234.1 hypothetical protein EMIHUDRAFT_196374 [Emiliania huxleyi CCMP1516]|eukprot:XP_005770663.1 hypothetical protein EMIHUDRAFT_196374 [Emiliania huxleyi CCMP1516]